VPPPHRFVGLAHRVQHRLRLVQMLAPGAVDFFGGVAVVAFGIGAELGSGENPRDALHNRTIGLGHFKTSLHCRINLPQA
jgi:hypothetical protein